MFLSDIKYDPVKWIAGMLLAQAGLVAERMGTKASAVARLESALVSGKHSPSIDTGRKKPFDPNYAV